MTSRVIQSDEHGLILKAQKGEKRAFSILVVHYWDKLYRWLFHLTHDQHTAEDLTQESFLKAYAALGTFQAGTNFQAWLFRIAHNGWVNHQRPKKRSRQPFPEELADSDAGPEEIALSKEAMQILSRAVGRLPRDFRAAFLLRAEQGLCFKEMAEILNISEETARWRVFKARQKLMEVMGPYLQMDDS